MNVPTDLTKMVQDQILKRLQGLQGTVMSPAVWEQISDEVVGPVIAQLAPTPAVHVAQSPDDPTVADVTVYEGPVLALGPDKLYAKDHIRHAWVPLHTEVGSLCPKNVGLDVFWLGDRAENSQFMLAILSADSGVIHAVSEFGEGLSDLLGICTRILPYAHMLEEEEEEDVDPDLVLDLQCYVSRVASHLSGCFPSLRLQFATQITFHATAVLWGSRNPEHRHLVRGSAFKNPDTKRDWLLKYPEDGQL